MLSRWRIRYKLLLGMAMLFLMVAILAFSSFQGVYAYRRVVRTISARATELPLSADLERRVSDLRYTLSLTSPRDSFAMLVEQPIVNNTLLREQFHTSFLEVRESLRRYREELQRRPQSESGIDDRRHEREAAWKIEQSLRRIEAFNQHEAWMLDDVKVTALRDEVDKLHRLASELPSYLQQRMHSLAGNVRLQYRTWIVLTWITSVLAGILLGLLVRCFYVWVFQPLRTLIRGSRLVAAGDFDHRITLPSHDEMAELARAMNDMTANFQQIRDDLNRQVKERTREVVRREQLASVGFLAAGVAHEINNPLASIAWSAESLEQQLGDLVAQADDQPNEEHDEETSVLRDYLRRIQEEAFRCKGITEQLLDFSRLGDTEKHDTDLGALVQDVIDMVRHLGRYRQKNIEFQCEETVIAPVNPPEIRQVILNLITNGLDSIDPGGAVKVVLRNTPRFAELLVSDDGCGMSEEVLEHLFEPFFTRRRDGQGIGLGLSITYRIVAEHGGNIAAASEGDGKGSEFRVTLPLNYDQEKQNQLELQAA